MPLFELAVRTAGTGRRMTEIAASVPHLLSVRAEKPPRRATALAALRAVEIQAAKLSEALEAAILDPWLNVAVAAEVIGAGLRQLGAELHEQEETGISATALQDDQTILANTRESLEDGLLPVRVVRQVARRGINLLQRHQLRGRPLEAGARMPAVFVCAVAKLHVPPPPRGVVEAWRGDLANFVCDLLLGTRLMKRVNRDFIETLL